MPQTRLRYRLDRPMPLLPATPTAVAAAVVATAPAVALVALVAAHPDGGEAKAHDFLLFEKPCDFCVLAVPASTWMILGRFRRPTRDIRLRGA